MKKIDLLKLIESMEDEAEVLDVLKDLEEVKSLAKDFDVNSITLEDFKTMLANNETIKGYYQSTLDSGIGKGVSAFEKNFTENKLPKIIEDELKKRSDEGLSESDIRARDYAAENEALKKQMKMKDLESKYKDTLAEKDLDTRLMKYILSEDEEKIIENIEFFNEIISSNANKRTRETLKSGEYVPPKGADTETLKNPFSKQYLNLTEQAKILKENPALASTLKASANK